MIRRLASLALMLAGCQPEPRAAGYFESHPEEAAKVVEECRTGAHRGSECEAAQTGLAAIQANRRLELFKKSFE